MRGAFIAGTGTGVGKTFVTRGIASALRQCGESVVALKPIETGFEDAAASDAVALARACGRSENVHAPGFYRARLPLSPYGAALEGEPPCPPLATLAESVRAATLTAAIALVEGAGGLLVPIDARHTTADLVHALSLPLVLVAPDQLGVLSHVLALFEYAERRGLRTLCVVLTAVPAPDRSVRTNRRILVDRLPVPVISFPRSDDDDEALGRAATDGGLVQLVRSVRPRV